MEKYLVETVLNAIAERIIGHRVIDADTAASTSVELTLDDVSRLMRGAFEAGQSVRAPTRPGAGR
ncbi:enoyl-ACP reductase [Burkholderia sp. IMCC1007]|uniref:enoyl-ACP reductase n=1 Tax=Burkholderia sp. IMCC1007 TaxID=3004104 RepID=UPI0022B424DF|nr:enoyl-ACP reductase [Burkholderia sp. IMCC1007]